MRVIAFVPMRHDSERVPGKNYRDLGGRPLFHHILATLSDVPQIERIVVDTDSPIIIRSCRESFPDVVCVERPEHLRDGHLPMTAVLQHDVSLFPSDWYLQTHSTNPLLTSTTVRTAIQRLSSDTAGHDSLFSVSRIQGRLFGPNATPLNHDPSALLRTQDLEPVFLENSNLYLFTGAQLAEGRRFGDDPLLFEIDPWEAVDIDTEPEFRIAEALFNARGATR